MKNRYFFIFFLIVGILFLNSCATQPIEQTIDSIGFLHGLFHGFIILFSFIISLFTDYEIYAFPNNGGWYNFGFLLGVMMFFGGGGAGTRKRRR